MNIYLKSLNKQAVRGEEEYVNRAGNMLIVPEDYPLLKNEIKYVGVTERFKDVIHTFHVPENETPAGFMRTYELDCDNVLRVDLKRNISYDKNGVLRPTNVLFSADSANPYEIAPISGLIANLTCNPGIVYDLFLNNPRANYKNEFKNREEVMREIARILGPGCDVSVELNNPFEEDMNKLLEEAELFKEIFSKYRIVIKVPHTGVVNHKNVHQLMEGEKKLDTRFDNVNTTDAFRGHNLALKFHEKGYRVNFTLMFEPYQTELALQAKPYFINSFIRHRYVQTDRMKRLTEAYELTGDTVFLEQLKEFLYANDYITAQDLTMDLSRVCRFARDLMEYRHINDREGADGLDGVRHNLRILKNCNLQDTRLIICSMEGEHMYPDIDRLLTEPEFMDMNKKVVITAEPDYLARFASTNQVISYQRRFMLAASGQK